MAARIMLKYLWLVFLIGLSAAAYALTGTSLPVDVPITITASSGGPTPPPGAVAAGFTTLAANFDFTNNQMCIAGSCVAASPLSNWLACAGASSPIWWLDNGVAQTCNQVVLTTDGGVPVMDLQFLRSLFASNYNTASILTSNIGFTTTSFGMPQGKYYEIKERITNVPSDCPLEPTSHCLFADVWAYGPVGDGGAGFIEWDFIEMYSATAQDGASTHPQGAAWNWNGPLSAAEPGNQAGYNPNTYNIFGVRVTTDGVGNYGECLYLNNNFSGCQTATGANSASAARNMLVLWSGEGGNVQLNSDSHLIIQWIRVWDCPGWATGECNGTVLSGSP